MRPGQESSLGTHLLRLREAAGLTQEELAFRAGLTPNAVRAAPALHPYGRERRIGLCDHSRGAGDGGGVSSGS